MTREEAKITLESYIALDADIYNEFIEAIRVAVRVLEQPEHNADDERKIADLHKMVNYLLSQSEQRWIPIRVRPMDDEERKEWSERIGYDIEYEEAVMFDCPMPDDGQEVWVCSKCGNVWQDTCQIDEGIYLEGNGDWLDIVAWMPFDKPEPYSERREE